MTNRLNSAQQVEMNDTPIDPKLSYSEQNYLLLNHKAKIKNKYRPISATKSHVNIFIEKNSNKRPQSGNMIYQDRASRGNPCTMSHWVEQKDFTEQMAIRKTNAVSATETIDELQDKAQKKTEMIEKRYFQERQTKALNK